MIPNNPQSIRRLLARCLSVIGGLVPVVFMLNHMESFGDEGASDGGGFYQRVAYPGEMDAQLAITGPSLVKVNTGIDLQVVSLGKDGELCDLSVPPAIICEGPIMPDMVDSACTSSIPLRRVAKGLYHPVPTPSFSKPGYYRLTVFDPSGTALPFGIPISAGAEAPSLLLHWGDLHGHSTLSDGTRTPDQYYDWARDVARLDMVALTDHNWALDDAKIEQLKLLCRKWYQPGRFVTFLSFEWALGNARTTPARGRSDHKCILFRGDDEDFSPWIPQWQNTPSVRELWNLLKGRDAIAIPHHTGLPHDTFYGTNSAHHNEQYERLAEVFSDWGSSETPSDRYPLPETQPGSFIRDALAMGCHLGLAGGSDTHRSRPGLNAIPAAGHPYALTALTAVMAPGRTREEIWTALYNRCCYATSGGRRHILDFALNESVMGSRITRKDPSLPSRLLVTIAGASDIKEIVIIKNSAPAAVFPGNGWCQSIEWTDMSSGGRKEDCYYVRVEFMDTSMAWSSPVWVSPNAEFRE